MNILYEYTYANDAGVWTVGVCPLRVPDTDEGEGAGLRFALLGCPRGCETRPRIAPDCCPVEFPELPQEWLDTQARFVANSSV